MNILNWLISAPLMTYMLRAPSLLTFSTLPADVNSPPRHWQRAARNLGVKIFTRLRLSFCSLVCSLWQLSVLIVFTVASIWRAPQFLQQCFKACLDSTPRGSSVSLNYWCPHSLVQDGKWCITTIHSSAPEVRKHPLLENEPPNVILSRSGLLNPVL